MRLRGLGSIRKRRGGGYQIRYRAHGRPVEESVAQAIGKPTRKVTETDAKNLLRQRLGELQTGRYVGPEARRLTVNEVLDTYLANVHMRRRRTIRAVTEEDGRIRYRGPIASITNRIRAAWGMVRAVDVTAAGIERWAGEMLAEGLTPGSAQTCLNYFRSALLLAKRQKRIADVPTFIALDVDNARQGFIEQDELGRLLVHLPDGIADAVRFAHLVGWRAGEVFGLEWSMVDRPGGVIRLPATHSKNRDARVIPLRLVTEDSRRVALDLGELIEHRWRKRALGCPFVFHRKGKRIKVYESTWRVACRKAQLWIADESHRRGGRPSKLFHDLRRTAYRNLIEAGVDPFTAMDICGHKTVSMARRYAIRNTRAMAKALAKTEAFLATTKPAVVVN